MWGEMLTVQSAKRNCTGEFFFLQFVVEEFDIFLFFPFFFVNGIA